MKMKKHLLLAVCALGLSSTALHASNQSVTASNGSGCTNNQSTGQTMSVGTEVDSDSQSATAFVKLEWELGRDKIPKIDCDRLFNIELAKQELELEKLRLELQIMKDKIAKSGSTEITTGDDW
jgi:hypothetical protein